MFGIFSERNIAERAMETERDTKNIIKGVGKLRWFISLDINRNIPSK